MPELYDLKEILRHWTGVSLPDLSQMFRAILIDLKKILEKVRYLKEISQRVFIFFNKNLINISGGQPSEETLLFLIVYRRLQFLRVKKPYV